jgi:cysteinyl-tRNA synthetase
MLKVFNTLTKKEEEFRTIEPNAVKMYVCGITPYNSCHIGHARCYVVFDVIRRYLEFLGYKINYIQNFTDIDDKIIKKSLDENVEFKQISEKYIAEFFDVMDELNIKRATKNPKVSDNMDKIISFIESLIKKDFAYEMNGDVYFKVKNFKEYGKLSGRDINDLKVGARVDVNEQKLDPLDFALWKKAKAGEPSWDSPWGKGRPGWHIECSVLALDNLGESIDIHGGGADLVFPHHENEIAQSESMTGKPFSNFWIHNGFVMINKEKMSKSLGNFFTLKDVLEKYNPMVLRLFLLTNHYRKPLDFSDDKLVENTKRFDKFLNFYKLIEKLKQNNKENFDLVIKQKDNFKFEDIEEIKQNFLNAMNNDFNTAMALAELHKLIDLGNNFSDKDVVKTFSAFVNFEELINILGLDFKDSLELERENIDNLSDEILKLIELRKKAREDKNWAESDRIRDLLKEKNIEIKDTKNGTEWTIKK